MLILNNCQSNIWATLTNINTIVLIIIILIIIEIILLTKKLWQLLRLLEKLYINCIWGL